MEAVDVARRMMMFQSMLSTSVFSYQQALAFKFFTVLVVYAYSV